MTQFVNSRYIDTYLRKHNPQMDADEVQDTAQDIYMVMCRKQEQVLQNYATNGMDGVKRYASVIASILTRRGHGNRKESQHRKHIVLDNDRDCIAEERFSDVVADLSRLLEGGDLVIWDLMVMHDFDIVAVAKSCWWRVDEARWLWESCSTKLRKYLTNEKDKN